MTKGPSGPFSLLAPGALHTFWVWLSVLRARRPASAAAWQAGIQRGWWNVAAIDLDEVIGVDQPHITHFRRGEKSTGLAPIPYHPLRYLFARGYFGHRKG